MVSGKALAPVYRVAVWRRTGTETHTNANAIVCVLVYASVSTVNQKHMSNIKSLSATLTNAVKVEIVSSCVWSHTAPYSNINTYEGETKFVSAAIALAKSKSEYTFTTIFVTTKEAGDWMYRFDITKHDLARLAAYEFVKVLPNLLAAAYGIHSKGFARLDNSEKSEDEVKAKAVAEQREFHQAFDIGITHFRTESCSKDDPIVTEAALPFDAIEEKKEDSTQS